MFTSLLKVAAIASALISSAPPSAAIEVAGAHSHHQASLPKKTSPPRKLDCDESSTGPFDSFLEYSCAYKAFHGFSSVLIDPVKMKEFEKLWNPVILTQAPELKMTGVSDANRKELTFSLIKRMRDFTHERFDYVQNQDDVTQQDNSDVHPVLEGGIGASLTLENGWMIEQSIFTAAPAEGISIDEYNRQKRALSVLSPTHRMIVSSTTQESPADGVLQSGDIIIAVDGARIEGKLYDDVIEHDIRGTSGTPVSLDVLRKNSTDPQGELQHLTLRFVRAKFDERAISVEDIDGVRHITVDNFVNNHLLSDFHRALIEAKTLHLKGVDVNLRGNPGGRVDYVLGMLEMVVPRGLLLRWRERENGATSLRRNDYTMLDGFGLTVSYKSGESDDSKPSVVYAKRVPMTPNYQTSVIDNAEYVYSHPLLPVIGEDMPVVVTQNGESYSASEIFAGAIKATHRGEIVGKPSAGKAATMIQVPLPAGGQVEVTDGQFYPGGVDTKYIGILPDYEIDQADDYGKTDAQQDKAGAVIEDAYKRLQAWKNEATVQAKINSDRFEKEMSERDTEDNKPVILEDVSAKK